MTDLEICKRIAQIEGAELFETYSKVFDRRKLILFYMDVGVKWHHAGESEESFFTKVYASPGGYLRAEFNPLKDKSLCFDLMVKYSIELTPMFSGCWCATVATTYTIDEQIDYKRCPSWLDDNPQRAICLAIIEANKGK